MAYNSIPGTDNPEILYGTVNDDYIEEFLGIQIVKSSFSATSFSQFSYNNITGALLLGAT